MKVTARLQDCSDAAGRQLDPTEAAWFAFLGYELLFTI